MVWHTYADKCMGKPMYKVLQCTSNPFVLEGVPGAGFFLIVCFFLFCSARTVFASDPPLQGLGGPLQLVTPLAQGLLAVANPPLHMGCEHLLATVSNSCLLVKDPSWANSWHAAPHQR